MRSSGYVQQDATGNYVLVGKWTFWHPNGQKQAEGEYLNARESGKRGETEEFSSMVVRDYEDFLAGQQ